jgi:cysteine desulfurase
LGLPADVAHGTIRFSLSRQNTQKEIDYTVNSVREVVDKLREMSPLWRK